MIYSGKSGSSPECVIVCPLDWGLGHASRMIPVVNDLLNSGFKVILGGSGNSGKLIREAFPRLLYVNIPCYTVNYPGHGYRLIISLILQLPFLLYSTLREHFLLRKLIKTYKIDLVVSDNRYGLFSNKTKNIFITHQISPVLPGILKFAEYPLYLLLKRIINCFDECWIPDYAYEDNLTGKLSHRYLLPSNSQYIGLLSRFSLETPLITNPDYYDIVVVLSGPQPELGRFTDKIKRQASELPLKILMITGMQKEEGFEAGNLRIVPHLPVSDFKNVLLNAGTIICRSGYSSIMDLIVLGIPGKAVLVPTPGQSEQEYLAEYLSKKGVFRVKKESELDLQYYAITTQK